MDSIKMAFESIADKKIRSLLTMLGIIIGVGAVLILVSVVQGYNADLTAYYEKQGVNKVNVTLLNFDRTNTTDQSGEFMDWVNGNLSDTITGVTPSSSTSGTLRFETNLNETAVIYFTSATSSGPPATTTPWTRDGTCWSWTWTGAVRCASSAPISPTSSSASRTPSGKP